MSGAQEILLRGDEVHGGLVRTIHDEPIGGQRRPVKGRLADEHVQH